VRWLLALALSLTAAPAGPSRPASRAPITALRFAPDGSALVAASQEGVAAYARAGERLALRARWSSAMTNRHALAFSPDGRQLAIAGGAPGESGSVELREWPGGGLLRTLTGHRDLVMAVAFGAGSRLATGSADQTIRLWSLAGGTAPRVLAGHAGPVLAVAFSPDGRWLATGSADQSVKLWDPASGELHRTLAQHAGAVEAVAFSPDGRFLATAGTDGTARVWQPEIGRLLRTIRGHDAPVRDLCYTPDGAGLLTAAADGRVRLLAADGPRPGAEDAVLHTFPTARAPLYAVAVTPDGRTVAVGGAEGRIQTYQLSAVSRQPNRTTRRLTADG